MSVGKILKWAFFFRGAGILLFIAYWFVIFYRSGLSTSSSKQELIDNYRTNQKEILALKSYFNSIMPKEYSVYIEFSGSNQIDLSFLKNKIP